jgi:hypothetical protein
VAKQEVIKNEYHGSSGQQDTFDRKYLKYLPALPQDRIIDGVLDALRTHDLPTIEKSLIPVANIANNSMYLLGIVCLIIEQEELYKGSKFGWSYLRYVEHLTEKLNIPIATISEAKIMMEVYRDNFSKLKKAGFTIEKNASKLRYLPEALENHDEEDVYKKIANSTFIEFRDWAQKKKLAHKVSPGPDLRVEAVIKGSNLYIDGKNILNFPRGTKTAVKEMIADDLCKTFSIRDGGGIPFITETYGKGEQIAIVNFIKKFRGKK